ncbi:MAG: carboxylate-amine ligase [Pseudomonadota bacterium]
MTEATHVTRTANAAAQAVRSAKAAKSDFSFGIEEEYHLVRLETDELADAPEAFIDACTDAMGDQVSTEFLKSQIEIGTRPHSSFSEARLELAALRTSIATVAREHGLAPVAAGTHPLSRRKGLSPTNSARYAELADALGGAVRRLVVCGMHVHVGLADDDLRIDIMNQARYFVPHLMVLATSSPFWEREATGLKSFRSVILDGLPRTGLPNRFDGFTDYTRTVQVLTAAGVIEDASKIWWDLRPSSKYPTLELRALDVCTDIDDAIAIAATFTCLCRMLHRLRAQNLSWRTYPVFLINENRWRAQRYGVEGSLVDFGRNALVPYSDLLSEILDLIAEDADALGCTAEVAHTRTIVARGTSADQQTRAYDEMVAAGQSSDAALRAVGAHLRTATIAT